MIRHLIPILALIAVTTIPALGAPVNANANSNGNTAGSTVGPGNSNAEKAAKVPKDEKVARDAVRKHQLLSLEAVTTLVSKTSSGRVLDVELVRLDSAYLYEVTVLEAAGRLHKLYYDARSGALMEDR